MHRFLEFGDKKRRLPARLTICSHCIEIIPPLVENPGNISRGSCKSCKQTSAHARVSLQDLQVPREIFPVFLTQGRLIFLLHLQKCPFLPFMTA